MLFSNIRLIKATNCDKLYETIEKELQEIYAIEMIKGHLDNAMKTVDDMMKNLDNFMDKF